MAIAKLSLAQSLAKTARILCDEHVNSNPELQAMVGDPSDQPVSWAAQFKPNPGDMLLPNPLSPMEGDEAFFAYAWPGARFQSHDGQQWEISDYQTDSSRFDIYNVWYPRVRFQVSLWDLRRSIDQWIEPVQITVPPPPPGVDYSAEPVRVIEGNEL